MSMRPNLAPVIVRALSFTLTLCTFALCTTAACSANETESVQSQCTRVRDQLVALEIPLADPHREAHKHVMRRAMGDAFIKTCANSMTEQQRGCVLAATDSRAASFCIARTTATHTSLEAQRLQ
jgi:hypothetical protein